jgi:hypothetical protein
MHSGPFWPQPDTTAVVLSKTLQAKTSAAARPRLVLKIGQVNRESMWKL